MPASTLDLKPQLDPRIWVFAAVEPSFDYTELAPIAIFKEMEGTTLVVERSMAVRHHLGHTFASKRITFGAFTELASIGILASVTEILSKHGIATNAFCAFYHDHIFVPEDRAEEALAILQWER